MASEGLKIDLSSALTAPLVKGRKVYEMLLRGAENFPVAEKVAKLKKHHLVQKLDEQRQLVLAVLGVALVLHGSEFKNLLLCTQVVILFLYERVKNSVTTLWTDITSARDRLKADTGAGAAKEETVEKSRNQKAKEKREKKNEPKPSFAELRKVDADMTKKTLKELDSEKITQASLEVLAAFTACLLVIHGGLAQKVAVAYSVVGFISAHLMPLVEFPGYEDLEEWTTIFVRFALWLVVFPLACFCGPLMLALNAASCGANLALTYGLPVLQARGKIADAAAFAASKEGLMALGGLTAFGTLYQLWTWAAGSGMGWYFQLIYLPAVIAEGILGFF